MKRIFSLLLISTVLAASAFANGDAEARRCAERVRQAGCKMSNNDFDRIDDNVTSCKHMDSGSGKTSLEIFLLRKSDKVVVVKTKGSDVSKPNCPTIKYTVDYPGVEKVKVIGNKAYLLSYDGQLYVMYADQSIYEIYNSRGERYRSLTDIKGTNGGQAIELIGRGMRVTLTDDMLQRKRDSVGSWNPQARKLNFYVTTTQRSLFRDEK